MKNLSVGDSVNLEADSLIKYVEKLLLFNQNKDLESGSREISLNWLQENGWEY